MGLSRWSLVAETISCCGRLVACGRSSPSRRSENVKLALATCMVLVAVVVRPSFAQEGENPRPGAWHHNSNNVEKRAQMSPADDPKQLLHVDISIEGRQSQSVPSRGPSGNGSASEGLPSAQTFIGLDGGQGSRSN